MPRFPLYPRSAPGEPAKHKRRPGTPPGHQFSLKALLSCYSGMDSSPEDQESDGDMMISSTSSRVGNSITAGGKCSAVQTSSGGSGTSVWTQPTRHSPSRTQAAISRKALPLICSRPAASARPSPLFLSLFLGYDSSHWLSRHRCLFCRLLLYCGQKSQSGRRVFMLYFRNE